MKSPSELVSGSNKPLTGQFVRRALWLTIGLFMVCGIAAGSVVTKYRIGVEARDISCLPWSVYWIKLGSPATVHRGDLLLVDAGRQMGQGFEKMPVVKMVGGIPGDVLEVKDNVARINGGAIGTLILREKLNIAPGMLDRREIVPEGSYLMIGTLPRSYDGRYWGFLPKEKIVGTAAPLF